MRNGSFYSRFGKRALDLVLALVAVIVLSPLLLGLAIMVRRKLGSPILFRQARPGVAGKAFTVLKFRTMTRACDSHGELLPDAERLTTFGRFLRSSSLDELPELLNVLRGEMSLVGPRPLHDALPPALHPGTDAPARCAPGITGWAQINGRNARTWDEKFRDDLYYVDHRSFAFDLKILFLTLRQVIKREGISAEGHATMPEFVGSSQRPNG